MVVPDLDGDGRSQHYPGHTARLILAAILLVWGSEELLVRQSCIYCLMSIGRLQGYTDPACMLICLPVEKWPVPDHLTASER